MVDLFCSTVIQIKEVSDASSPCKINLDQAIDTFHFATADGHNPSLHVIQGSGLSLQLLHVIQPPQLQSLKLSSLPPSQGHKTFDAMVH